MLLLQYFDTLQPAQLMLTFHGSEIQRLASRRLLRWSTSHLLAKATRISVVSAFARDLLQRSFPAAADKVVITPGALRTDLAVEPAAPQPRRKLVILTVARINPRKGQEKYVYTYNEAEYRRKLAELTKRGQPFKEPQRYKGLGEMDAHELAETTMNPRQRTLRRITVDDAGSAESTFEKLMGNDVAPRREFIIEGAYALDAERIDV